MSGQPVKKARLYERYYSFDQGGAGTGAQLSGQTKANGEIGFGAQPCYAGFTGELARGSDAFGWRPEIVSLSYLTVPPMGVPPAAHTVRVTLQGQALDTADFHSGAVQPLRWTQLVGDFAGAPGFRLERISVPVDETNGTPYNIRLITTDRTQDSMVIVDWEWGRAIVDTDRQQLVDIWETLRNIEDGQRRYSDGLRDLTKHLRGYA